MTNQNPQQKFTVRGNPHTLSLPETEKIETVIQKMLRTLPQEDHGLCKRFLA